MTATQKPSKKKAHLNKVYSQAVTRLDGQLLQNLMKTTKQGRVFDAKLIAKTPVKKLLRADLATTDKDGHNLVEWLALNVKEETIGLGAEDLIQLVRKAHEKNIEGKESSFSFMLEQNNEFDLEINAGHFLEMAGMTDLGAIKKTDGSSILHDLAFFSAYINSSWQEVQIFSEEQYDYLIRKVPGINLQSLEDGSTALHWAAYANLAMAVPLLKAGADLFCWTSKAGHAWT